MVAAVRAAGKGAELWSFEKVVRDNAGKVGVKAAPESSTVKRLPTDHKPDVRAGLDNVGLHEWSIDPNGGVNRTTSGEITTPGPGPGTEGRGGPVAPPTGPELGAPQRGTVTEGRGEPIAPITVPEPAAAGLSAKAGCEGAA